MLHHGAWRQPVEQPDNLLQALQRARPEATQALVPAGWHRKPVLSPQTLQARAPRDWEAQAQRPALSPQKLQAWAPRDLQAQASRVQKALARQVPAMTVMVATGGCVGVGCWSAAGTGTSGAGGAGTAGPAVTVMMACIGCAGWAGTAGSGVAGGRRAAMVSALWGGSSCASGLAARLGGSVSASSTVLEAGLAPVCALEALVLGAALGAGGAPVRAL